MQKGDLAGNSHHRSTFKGYTMLCVTLKEVSQLVIMSSIAMSFQAGCQVPSLLQVLLEYIRVIVEYGNFFYE